MATAFTVFLIAAAYTQVIELFPNGGGGYRVASTLLGPKTGLVAGGALLTPIALLFPRGPDALIPVLILAAFKGLLMAPTNFLPTAVLGDASRQMASASDESAQAITQIAGAVGVYGNLDPAIEAAALGSLGLRPETVATQIVQKLIEKENVPIITGVLETSAIGATSLSVS